VAAQQSRRTIAALDEHAVSVLIVQVERAPDGVQAARFGPIDHALDQRLKRLIVL
jgi:hypothetical protein